MNTFEYISLDDEDCQVQKRRRMNRGACGREQERGKRGRSRRTAGGPLLGKRLLLGLVIVAAGTVTAWGLQGGRSGEATWGNRVIEYYGEGQGQADLLMLVNKDHPLPETYEPQLLCGGGGDVWGIKRDADGRIRRRSGICRGVGIPGRAVSAAAFGRGYSGVYGK